MTPREIEKKIKRAGWAEDKALGKGSHRVYRHETLPGIVTIPWHATDIPKGTAQNILKGAGIK